MSVSILFIRNLRDAQQAGRDTCIAMASGTSVMSSVEYPTSTMVQGTKSPAVMYEPAQVSRLWMLRVCTSHPTECVRGWLNTFCSTASSEQSVHAEHGCVWLAGSLARCSTPSVSRSFFAATLREECVESLEGCAEPRRPWCASHLLVVQTIMLMQSR